jgi:hemolysin III
LPSVLKDPASGLSHLAGAVLSVLGLVALLRVGIANHDTWQIVSFAIFGGSLILLYSASATYHLLSVSVRAEVVLRKLDHIMIFVLIAGTYTPVCLIALRGPAGYAMLAVVWSLAVAGVFFKVFCLNAPRWAYTGVYLLMGWMSLFIIVPLARAVGLRTLLWLLIGGVFYSLGAVIYGLKKPNLIPRWLGFHEIFHLFIILGSLSHFYFVYLLAQ